MREAQTDLRLTSYYENAVQKLQLALKPFETHEKHLICIGIGHFSECSISRHQLAFILSIKELFSFQSVVFHEPILSRAESSILKQLNCSVAVKNLEGKIEIDGVTLVYAPHCPKQLINNFLWKNWNGESLKQLIYVGNSFSNLLNSTPSRFLEADAGFIVKLQPHCEEIELENNFKFTDIFNDTSIHQFSGVTELPQEFWNKQSSEPVYGSENLELITIDLIEKLTIWFEFIFTMAGNQLYRSLLNELRLSNPAGKLNKESMAYKYITDQFEKHQTTDQTLCKAKEEMRFLGETYLCYLRSQRKYTEILNDYKGNGERSVKETADMVGFKLPHDPKWWNYVNEEAE